MRTGMFKTKISFVCHVSLLLSYFSFVFCLNDNLMGGYMIEVERGKGVIHDWFVLQSLASIFGIFI